MKNTWLEPNRNFTEKDIKWKHSDIWDVDNDINSNGDFEISFNIFVTILRLNM